MTKFSANLGFLWTELPLPEAIRAAKAAGFDAVECHWPYDTPPALVIEALAETGLEMLGINTSRGDVAAGENGLSALPRREGDAGGLIDQAIAYAAEIGARAVHVLAGKAQGAAAEAAYIENLSYACRQASAIGATVLIEPLNLRDAPGYFLSTTTHASEIIDKVGASNLKLMFDCYHVQIMEGDLSARLRALAPILGHVQFASVPDRGAPDQGEVNYRHLFNLLDELGYERPLGAEYKPNGATEASLGWMNALRG
ncbi:MAG: TIM barrel protein [Neomegalonema sp.]|nr:TIM barrel protein [Neomegalonema sp.]